MEEQFDLSPEEIERIKQLYEEEEKKQYLQEGREKEEDEPRYEPFPFDQLERINLSELPLLEHALKVFSLLLKSELFRLGLDVEGVEKGKTELVKYRHYMENFDEDMYFVAFKAEPLPSYGVLAFRLPFLLSLISLLLGGEPEPPRVEKNIITSTEYKILERFFRTILKTLEKQLSEFKEVNIDIVDTDTDKSLAKFNLTDKRVLITDFTIKFANDGEETFYLILDEEMIEPLIPVLMGSKEAQAEDYKRAIWKAVRTAEIPLKVLLHAPPRTLEQVLEWKPGDTIILEEFANKPVKGYIEGNPVMEGYLGKHQGFYALMFLRWLKE